MRQSYNTKQKKEILEHIRKKDKQFTIKELYNELNYSSLTTIYRVIDKLLDEGYLNKTTDASNTYYQYLERCDNNNHFYLKCEKCGSLIHIDCDCIEKITNHFLKIHNFVPNKEKIIINGFCERCR